MKLPFIITLVVLFALTIDAIKVGDNVCINAGLNLRKSPCGAVVRTSKGTESGKVGSVKKQKCSFGTYTWASVSVSGLGNVWAAVETKLVHTCNSNAKKDHNVPQVHQLWDTPNAFAGGWACGPTCAVMAAAYYKRLKPKPITINAPVKHTNDFGWYVSNKYTSPSGTVLSRGQKDAKGRIAYGAYGTCTEGGLAWAWRIQEFFKYHKLQNKFYDAATQNIVKSAINKGHLVVLSTRLTGAGHLVLVRGYENGGAKYIVNDPYGNANVANYGRQMNGKAVRYTWAKMQPKWMVEVWA